MSQTEPTIVAIIGAGPVGLAAAAQALERGLEPIVLEAGPTAGHAVRQWGHVRMFSPWAYDIDAAARRLLQPSGWNQPDPADYPTGGELLERYLEPLATRTALKHRIRLSSRVEAISRRGFDKVKSKDRAAAPFEIRYRNGPGPRTLLADAVIDASGTWSTPSPAGANGLAAIGERNHAARIAYGMPDVLGEARARYAGKRIAVLGAGHSAIGTLIDLVALAATAPDTQPVWLLRGTDPAKAYGGGANDKLAARGALGAAFARLVTSGQVTIETGFGLSEVATDGDRLLLVAGAGGDARHVTVDELIVATGFRPDHSFLSELRLALDPALDCPPDLAPLIDPNLHSCGTVRPHGARELAQPEPGLYIAGMKSYGRAPTFLMLTGYEQVRSIVAEIAGDHAAVARVELVLPETGVCSGIDSRTSGCAAPAEAAGLQMRSGCAAGRTEAQQGLPGQIGHGGVVGEGRSATSPAGTTAAETCCGGPPIADPAACCRSDEAAKQAGQPGCAEVAQPAIADASKACYRPTSPAGSTSPKPAAALPSCCA